MSSLVCLRNHHADSFASLDPFSSPSRHCRSAEVLYGQTIPDAMSVLPIGVQGALVQAYLAHRTSGVRSTPRLRLLDGPVTGACISGLVVQSQVAKIPFPMDNWCWDFHRTL